MTTSKFTAASIVTVGRGVRGEPALLIDGQQVLGFGVEVSLGQVAEALGGYGGRDAAALIATLRAAENTIQGCCHDEDWHEIAVE